MADIAGAALAAAGAETGASAGAAASGGGGGPAQAGSTGQQAGSQGGAGAGPASLPAGQGNAGAAAGAGAAGQGAGQLGGGQAAAADPGWVSIRDAAKTYGLDLSGYPDDHAALQNLLLRARQSEEASQLAQYGQRYLQHAGQFEAYLREQQQRAEAERQKQASWFKAPEWNPAWRSMLTKDDKGNIVPAQGAPPDIVGKYLAGVQHQQEFLEKFAFDPLGAIKPGLEQMVREMAGQLVQQNLGQYGEQQFASGFVQQNSSWLHQADPLTGQQRLSPAGQAFAGYVQEAIQVGVQGEQNRTAYAMRMLRAEMAGQQAQQGAAAAQAQNAGQQAKQNFLAQAGAGGAGLAGGGATQLAGAAGVQQQPGVAAGGPRPKPLMDRMRERLAAAGVTDQTVAGTLAARR